MANVRMYFKANTELLDYGKFFGPRHIRDSPIKTNQSFVFCHFCR